MERDDYPQFQALWTSTCDLYGKQPSDAAVTMAFRSLARYELADVRRALDAHVSDADGGRFMPKPADLVRHIDGDPESASLQAWSKVEDAIRRIGPWQSVVFDEPSIMAAIEEMGGWIDLCKVTDKELPFRRNEFTKRYKGYINRPPTAYPNKLKGSTEAINEAQAPGWQTDPMLVGDARKAHQLYHSAPGKAAGPVRLSQVTEEVGETLELGNDNAR